MKKALESKLQSSILSDLESYGDKCEVFKIERANKNGFPDIFFTMECCGPCMVEAKREGERPSDLQKHRIARLNACGCKTFVCDTWSEWMKVKSVLGIPPPPGTMLSPKNL